MVVKIERPATSLLADAEPEDRERISGIAETIRGAGNWKGRKRRLLDVLVGLDRAMSEEAVPELLESGEHAELRGQLEAAHAEERQALAEAGEDPGEPLDTEALVRAVIDYQFLQLLPAYVGSLLEVLDEGELDCVEQAAFYYLSGHPEHVDAAEAWFAEDHRNETAFRKFLRANRDYAEILERYEEMLEAEGEDGEDGEEDGAEPTPDPANDDTPPRNRQ